MGAVVFQARGSCNAKTVETIVAQIASDIWSRTIGGYSLYQLIVGKDAHCKRGIKPVSIGSPARDDVTVCYVDIADVVRRGGGDTVQRPAVV